MFDENKTVIFLDQLFAQHIQRAIHGQTLTTTPQALAPT
jgi:hypothetical protein